ncbi:hypothetical protein RJ639_012355 [Escallonia herrerae]|uniref:Uncharacterized protein n=1 Tax=Escallonia herrerae TaxID=1293975 RepID=A0AA88VM50_9ASTE|nr:hypothetical protein RJ639_012355 [Escallonia herrerae]
MSGKSRDQIIHQSSISLLQERFRQLQRAKEIREEREFLRLLSIPQPVNPSTPYHASRSFYRSEPFLPSRPTPQTSLSVQYNLQSKHADLEIKAKLSVIEHTMYNVRAPGDQTQLQYIHHALLDYLSQMSFSKGIKNRSIGQGNGSAPQVVSALNNSWMLSLKDYRKWKHTYSNGSTVFVKHNGHVYLPDAKLPKKIPY